MGKKLLQLKIQTAAGLWSFEVLADPKHLEEWHAAGLDIGVIQNKIPDWLPSWIAAKHWAFMQDLLGFKNPWGGK